MVQARAKVWKAFVWLGVWSRLVDLASWFPRPLETTFTERCYMPIAKLGQSIKRWLVAQPKAGSANVRDETPDSPGASQEVNGHREQARTKPNEKERK